MLEKPKTIGKPGAADLEVIDAIVASINSIEGRPDYIDK